MLRFLFRPFPADRFPTAETTACNCSLDSALTRSSSRFHLLSRSSRSRSEFVATSRLWAIGMKEALNPSLLYAAAHIVYGAAFAAWLCLWSADAQVPTTAGVTIAYAFNTLFCLGGCLWFGWRKECMKRG
jgi:hypothetical protein